MRFANNQALIIGGSSGIGLEAAKLLAEAGAAVHGNITRSSLIKEVSQS